MPMGEGIIIRTMKDDVADLKNQAPSVAVQKAVLPKKELRPIPEHASKARSVFGILGVGVLLILISAGGWYGVGVLRNVNMLGNNAQEELPISEIIPKSASMIVVYDLANEISRANIEALWATPQEVSQPDVVNGGPAGLLGITEITEAYYFTLGGSSSPFLVVKDSDQVTQFISQQRELQFTQKGGWIVAHHGNLNAYDSALASGAMTGEDIASLLGSSGFIARYIINPSDVSTIFSLPGSIKLNRKQIVFDVSAGSLGDGLHGEYQISGSAVPASVLPDTTSLASLIPSDPSFMRMGSNFFTDISEYEQMHHFFDAKAYNAPAVQQFLAKLVTPYSLYVRTGADGVPDIGLIIQLPDQLQGKLKYKESVVEQLLISMAPLVSGRPLATQIVFGDGINGSVPLRYTNLEGQTASLDYTIGDNFILIASSREGMQELTNMATGNGLAMLASGSWTNLVGLSDGVVQSDMVLGTIQDPATLMLLPGGSARTTASVLVSTKQDHAGINTNASIVFTK